MRLGYNTNGLAHHRLADAVALLAEEGYQSVAITLDAGALDPYDDPSTLARQTAAIRRLLDRHGLGRVVETGARYLLNPRLKHDPTLMDPDPARRAVRVDFLRRAIDLAVELDSGVVSFWSGILRDDSPEDAAMDRLAEALGPVRARAGHVHRHLRSLRPPRPAHPASPLRPDRRPRARPLHRGRRRRRPRPAMGASDRQRPRRGHGPRHS